MKGYRVAQGKSIESLLFPVKQEELQLANGSSAGAVAVSNEMTGEILYIGKTYQLIDNRDVIRDLELFENEGFYYNDVRNWSDKRFEINLVNPDLRLDCNGLPCHFRIKVHNSYDGTMAYSFAGGFYIQVCSNGATVGKALTYKRKHTGIHDIMGVDYRRIYESVNNIANKMWMDLEEEQVESIMGSLTTGIIDPKGTTHPTKTILRQQYNIEKRMYKEKEFALFMASTYIATHGHALGITPSYQNIIEKNISKTFFNEVQ